MSRRTFHALFACLLALGLIVGAAGAAWAAPPGNDDLANAIPVSPGNTLNQSTVEATTETGEDVDHCAPVGATVWFSFTPAEDVRVQFDTFGSDFDTVLAAFEVTGSGHGGLDFITCNDDASDLQSRVRFDASAGTTYAIQVGGFGGETGNLQLTIGEAGPALVIEDLRITGGSVTPKTGVVVLRGSVTCSGGPDTVFLDAFVQQRIGRSLVNGYGFDEIECDGTTSFAVEVDGSTGLFVAGKAYAELYAYGDDDEAFTSANIRLRR